MKQICRVLILVGLSLSTLSAQINVTSSVREFRQANEHRLFNEFIELLKMPNVASDTPNIRRNANYLIAEMQKGGLKSSARCLRRMDDAGCDEDRHLLCSLRRATDRRSGMDRK